MVKFTNVMKINGYEYDEFYPDKFDKLENVEFKAVKIFIQDIKFRVNGTGEKKKKMV